jgi:hypothetical protein
MTRSLRTIRKRRTIREEPAARAAGRETRESCSACPCRAHPPSHSTSSSARRSTVPGRFPDCAPNQIRDPDAAKFFAIPCDFATLTAVMEDERRIFR